MSSLSLWAAEPALRVVAAWARASAPSAEVGGAFAVLINDSDHDDALLAATSEAAEEVELHTHLADARGLLHMEPVERIALPARSRTIMKPGGFHFMLMGLKQQLKPGGLISLTCRFASGHTVTVTVPILEAGAMGLEPARQPPADSIK